VLRFDIDSVQLRELSERFGASSKDVESAYSRAMKRTAGNIRKLSSKGLQSELGLRNATALRRRIKEFRFKGRSRSESIVLWYGVNDLPLSAFKGRPVAVPGGIEFNGTKIVGAFFARPGGKKRGIYQRAGAARYPLIEATMPVADRMMIYLEDEVFVDIEGLFFRNFASEIKARTIYGVGQ
jgi:hypothetical protein